MRRVSITAMRIEREADLHYWAERWGVPTFEIRRAVDRAGPALADVRKCLQTFRPSFRVEETVSGTR